MPGWERRGHSQYPEGGKFVRASGEEDWCNGFFVALLGKRGQEGNERKRGREGETESVEQNNSLEKKKKKKKKEIVRDLDTPPAEFHDVNETDTAVKPKKKSKKKVSSWDSDEDITVLRTSDSDKKKKKKKKKSID